MVGEAPWRRVTSHEIDTLRGSRLIGHRNGRGSIHLSETAGTLGSGAGGLGIWNATIGQSSALFQIERAKDVMALLRRKHDRQ